MTKKRRTPARFDALRCADCRSRIEERTEDGSTTALVWHSITCPEWRSSAPELALVLVGDTPTTLTTPRESGA